ncbi:MAG: (2Fe-2S)-binding protein [Arcobacter sp.]|nr:MAG: (2Fe-2S)-binding protein [Arcobacter sp.]
MFDSFEKDYEVCNCRKVTLEEIEIAIKEKEAKTLRDIQDITSAGTDCRHCIFTEGDFGKMKKKIYCKDILNKVLNG